MRPPLCCIGSHNVDSRDLRHAFYDICKRAGFNRDAGSHPLHLRVGFWERPEGGAWLYFSLNRFHTSATGLIRYLGTRLSLNLGQTLRVYTIDQTENPPQQSKRKQRSEIVTMSLESSSDGRLRLFREPRVDWIFSQNKLPEDFTEAAEMILGAYLNSETLSLTPQRQFVYTGSQRKLGLINLAAAIDTCRDYRLETMENFITLRLVQQGNVRLTHFLLPEEYSFIEKCSLRIRQREAP